MKKTLERMLFVIFILIFIFSSLVSAIRINEIMPNPDDNCNDCSEWIELYGQNENLTNYEINTTNEKTNFSIYIENYIIITKNKTAFMQIWNVSENKIIEWRGMSLVNSGENIFLFDNSFNLISNISYPSFSSYENRTYSFLSNLSWVICDKASPSLQNLCESNQTQQNQTQQNQSQTSQEQARIYLELEYDDEVENWKEIEVEVKAFNLDGKYDIKVYLEKEKIISETYNENESVWRSSNYYLNEFFSGLGNKSGLVKLRLDSDYKNFSGEAEIKARIRKSDSSNIIAEFSGNISIKQKQVAEASEEEKIKEEALNSKEENSANIIKLNRKSIKSQNSESVYKSKTQYIKEYAIYGFALFCVFVIIIIILKKI